MDKVENSYNVIVTQCYQCHIESNYMPCTYISCHLDHYLQNEMVSGLRWFVWTLDCEISRICETRNYWKVNKNTFLNVPRNTDENGGNLWTDFNGTQFSRKEIQNIWVRKQIITNYKVNAWHYGTQMIRSPRLWTQLQAVLETSIAAERKQIRKYSFHIQKLLK